MADRAKRTSEKRVPAIRPVTVVDKISNQNHEVTPIQMLIAQGYARGVSIGALARKYHHLIVPHEPDERKRLRKTRLRIRKWLATAKMRDIVWAEAKTNLDLESPSILKAVATKAKRGRVDAARLALELSGRHAPHTEIQPAQVVVAFNGLPRPGNAQLPQPADVDVDSEEIIEVDEDDL